MDEDAGEEEMGFGLVDVLEFWDYSVTRLDKVTNWGGKGKELWQN